MRAQHEAFKEELPTFETAFSILSELYQTMSELGSTENPYSPHNFDTLSEKWNSVQELVKSREEMLSSEAEKQAQRESLRLRWSKAAQPAFEVYINYFFHYVVLLSPHSITLCQI